MNCPFCHASNSRVLDSRLIKQGSSTRRRRECPKCKNRFTTYESVEMVMPRIHKKDGRREVFNKDKLKQGIEIACQKLSISPNQINNMIEDIEKRLLHLNQSEVRSWFVGNLVMMKLKELNPVAYVRFASVYKSFEDIDEFFHNLKMDTYKDFDLMDKQ